MTELLYIRIDTAAKMTIVIALLTTISLGLLQLVFAALYCIGIALIGAVTLIINESIYDKRKKT